MGSAADAMKQLQKMFLEQMGKDPSNHIEEPFNDNERGRDERKFSAEATLRSLQWPVTPKVSRECKGCGFNFLTEYLSVAYCSSLCRKAEMKKYGIDWKDKPLKHSYGGMTPPGVIPPDALKAMADVLTKAGYKVLDPKVVEVALPDSDPPLSHQTQKPYEPPKEPESKLPAAIPYADDYDFSL